ncbi:MAG TPA: twin-arginine translocase subunit TatC [Burkholderiaceae bacterium]|nr:twin-arginine translocase subunit TatC [Burkholderiaceae bacterium]
MSSPPSDSTETPDQEQGFLSHLIELRQRLVRAALAVVVIFLPLSFFMKDVFDLVSRPLMVALPAGTKLLSTGVVAPFMVPLKVTLFLSFLLALPFVLWQAWAFVAPGLYKHEKRLAGPLLVSSVFMFMLGICYCYFVVFGLVFKFITRFAPESVHVAPDIEAYFSFVLGMFLAFGVTFEVPIVVVLLARFGIASVARLRQMRPYVVVGAFILAAIFTPPDVLSQLLLAIPLCLLYELGVFCARFVERPARSEEKAAA